MAKTIQTGLDTLKTHRPDILANKRLGLLANPASVTRDLTHAKTLIAGRFKGQLAALFSPQHGFFAEKQDNMIESGHGRDPDLGIPVFSLYSDTRKPTEEMFDPIDTLVVDIQDVGTRVYTFIYTITYCMERAAQMNRHVVILDRPNPVGGTAVEGNLLEPEFASFVGRFPIPMRHGMTVGEICRYINEVHGIGCDLTVISMTGWKRRMYWPDTGLTWIPPSPNLPTPLSAMVYPGQVIFEGTNISEGRGTTLPFEQFGAPWVDTQRFLAQMAGHTPGLFLRPVCFEPTSQKWMNQVCYGAHLHVLDREVYSPYQVSLKAVQALLTAHAEHFQFKTPPYEYEYEQLPMDLILGSRTLRQILADGQDLDQAAASWQEPLLDFQRKSSKFYLYD